MSALTSNRAGAGFMVLAMGLFAIEDTLFKAATQSASIASAMLVFGATGLAVFATLSKRNAEPVWHPACLKRTMLIRSAFELMGRLFFALALAFAPLSSTSSILQAAPIVVTLGAALFLGEAVGWRRWLAMFAGFLGVLLVIRPSPSSFEITSLFALLATIGFAGRDLATRVSPPAMSTAQLGSLGFLVVTVGALVIAAFETAPLALPQGKALGLCVAAGVVGVAAYGALTLAMRAGDVGFVAPFRYARLIFAFAISYVVFGERPDIYVWLGAMIIVCAGLYSFMRDRGAGSRAANEVN